MLRGFESCECVTNPDVNRKQMNFSNETKVNIENESWFYAIVFMI